MHLLEREHLPAPPSAPATPDAPAGIVLDRIARRFGRRWPLRGASVRLAPGSVVALLGPNGSGKTTLLRILASLLRPTRGTGTVFGHDLVRDGARIRTGVGLLGHAPGVYGDLTAAENLRFAARMLGAPAGDAALAALLERVGLGAHAGERVRGFSVGMQRRVALARLLLREPRLLLLDEPHAAFDAEGITLVHDLALRVRAAGGIAIIATHAPERATAILDRAVRLERGRLVETDPRGETDGV